MKALPFADVAAPKFVPSVRIPGYRAVQNCGPVFAGNKIVGGEVVTPHEFPWQVGMYMDASSFCGGSIISEEWVLTAAHCTMNARQIEVIAGAQMIHDTTEPSRISQYSSEFFEHPEWSYSTLQNDLALIHLPEPLTFSDAIAPVCLPKRSSPDLQEGDMMTATGWGRTSDNSEGISDELRAVTVPVYNHERCADFFGTSTVTDGVVCLDSAGGHGICNGDSGGPLTWVEDGRSVTRGIHSFVSGGGCESGNPEGDTNVKKYLDWIEISTGIIVED